VCKMKNKSVLLFSVLLNSTIGLSAHASPVLEQKLESLYQEVSQKFENNLWFKNQANQDLMINGGFDPSRLPPEFQMPTLEAFKSHMKSYCVLMESANAKKVARPDHYSVVDYSQDATFRRLYVYNLKTKEVTHNTWGTHGTNSYAHGSLTLKDTSSGYKNPVLQFSDELTSSFFSNDDGTYQSTIGMTISESKTYWSSQFSCNALRMSGLDGALNSRILSRAIVVHAFDYSVNDIGRYKHLPASWGCVMLPRSGYYQGTPDAPIADIIIKDMMGGPILLYHDRMKPEVNEKAYQDQLEIYAELQMSVSRKLSTFATQFYWTPEQVAQYQNELSDKLKKLYLEPVQKTYEYFKTPSKFVGKEPKSENTCMKALNLL
jgi:hypothetical protein